MAVTVDDIAESAAAGVLRALNARKEGVPAGATELVRSGFFVDISIRAGGRILELNPQPLPPVRPEE